MKNRYKFSFVFCCILGDFLALFTCIYIIMYHSNNNYSYWNPIVLNNITAFSVITWIICSLYFKLYSIKRPFNIEAFYRFTWRAFLAHFILFQSFIFIFHENDLNHIILKSNLYQFSFWMLYILLSRIFITLLVLKIRNSKNKLINVAIWGFNVTSIELAAQLELAVNFINFKGILNEHCEKVFNNQEDFKKTLCEAITNAHEQNIDELYIVTATSKINDLNYYFELADKLCMRINFVPDLSGLSTEPFLTTNFNNFQVIKPRHEPLQDSNNRLVKRVFDILFSLLVIIFILSWLYPIVGFIIKYQSKGPVLFKQLRTGKKNKSFWCYKFRSMEVNQNSDSLQASQGDPRVTPIGRFIRRTSIDELPQFFNVFKGDMSVVGPRPHMLKHTKEYNELIANFMVRHYVKPGITGLAQVSGYRGETKKVSDMKKRINADIQYVQYWNLIKDIKICLLTIIVTLKGDKNAF